MDLHSEFVKLRKYPTAAAALVFSSVFSFLLAPAFLLRKMDFYLVWILSALFAIQIWSRFREDRSYKVSGIVPAWLELIAGILLLFFCPIREISLIFVMLAVCSYAAGIIFSVKMTGPLVLFLGVAPNLPGLNKFLTDIMDLTARRISDFVFSTTPEILQAQGACGTADCWTLTGTPQLFWSLLLAAFPLTVFLCKTAYERFSTYCVVFVVFFFSDILRFLLLANISGTYGPVISFWVALLAGTAFVAGLLITVNHVTSKGEKK